MQQQDVEKEARGGKEQRCEEVGEIPAERNAGEGEDCKVDNKLNESAYNGST